MNPKSKLKQACVAGSFALVLGIASAGASAAGSAARLNAGVQTSTPAGDADVALEAWAWALIRDFVLGDHEPGPDAEQPGDIAPNPAIIIKPD